MGEQSSVTISAWGVLTFTLVTTNPTVAIAGIAGLTVCFVTGVIAGTIIAQNTRGRSHTV